MYAYVPSGDPSMASKISCLTTTMRDTPNGLHGQLWKYVLHVRLRYVMLRHVMLY